MSEVTALAGMLAATFLLWGLHQWIDAWNWIREREDRLPDEGSRDE